MTPTGVDVHMRLNKVMTSMLVEIHASNRKIVERDGTMIVKLDKGLYGCVEASNLWYNNLKDKLTASEFKSNPCDSYGFNKMCKSSAQTTVVVHVDDLMVTSASESDLNDFCAYLIAVYPETKETRGDVVDCIGMTFDFTKAEVSVTVDNCVDDKLVGSGVTKRASSPATKFHFNAPNVKKLSLQDAQFFPTYVAKLLYLAKNAWLQWLFSPRE
jgi:hypothetical protein